MSKKRTRRQPSDGTTQAINWKIIGGIGVFGVLGLVVLLIVTISSGPTAAEPAEALSLVEYCEDNPSRCLSVGAADAPNTVLEMSDYGCSHCRDFNLTTAPLLQEQFVASGQLKWWLFPFAFGEQTSPSTTALFCAAEQADDAQLIAFHEGLFTLQETRLAHQLEGFTEIALSVGLDADTLAQCIESGKYVETVRLNRQAAEVAGVNGTPSFFINGTLLTGNRPLSDFTQRFIIIDSN